MTLPPKVAKKSYQRKLQDYPPHDFLLHSWFERTAHVVRYHQRTQKAWLARCEIKELEVNPADGNVRIRVQFNDTEREQKQYRSKMVTPMALMAAQMFVCFKQGCSETDEDTFDHKVYPITQRLPPLTVSNASDVFQGAANVMWMRKLKATLKEVNGVHHLLAHRPHVDDVFDFDTLLISTASSSSSSKMQPAEK